MMRRIPQGASPMSLSLRPPALAVLLCGAIACSRSDAPPAPDATARAAADAPVPAAPYGAGDAAEEIPDDAVAAFLVATYGNGARLQGAWKSAPVDATLKAKADETDGAVTRTVCAREDVRIGGQPSVLLAVCGTPAGFGHSTPGITDFFLLQPRGDALAASARAHKQEYGSMGNAGEIEVERLGGELYGFVVESGFYNMGEGVQSRHILLPKDTGFHEAGWFRASMDNAESMAGCAERGGCAPEAAYEVAFAFDIDDGNPQADAYPLVVIESGNECGKPVNQRHRLALDPATMTYAVPKRLQRDACAETP
jgi:hypothetical protein